jgi:hypothetical protein
MLYLRSIAKALNTKPNVFQLATFCHFPSLGIFIVLGGREFVQENTKHYLDFGELLFLFVLGLAVSISVGFLHIFRLLHGN